MEYAEILREYKELRRKSVALSTRLVKMLDKDEIGAAASALGLLSGRYIDLETEDELAVVMDYAIHNLFRDGKNAVDRLLEEHPYPEGSAELRLLRAMPHGHFTILDVQEVIPGVGVRGLDGPQEAPVVVVDIGFSTTATPGMALATRIISPVEGWWMTTGAALPLSDESLELIIGEHEAYARRHGVDMPESERERIVRWACIAAGTSRQIRYADPKAGGPSRGGEPAMAAAPRIGRNDPCPCGSGKKYKKCCGG